MKIKKHLAYSVLIILSGLMLPGRVYAQKWKPATDFIPNGRPPVERSLEQAVPAVPQEVPEGIHALDGRRRLILQNLSVGIMISDYDDSEQEVANYLVASGHVLTADFIDARYSTPALEDIQDYDVIITWSNYQYYDATAIGDLLADYVDLGKGVVALEFAYYDGWALQGRFMSEQSPFTQATTGYADVALGSYDSDHPLMHEVSAVTEYFAYNVGLTGNATGVAAWDNYWPFVAYNNVNNRVVGINGYIGIARLWTGDMLRVVLNSVLFVTGNSPTACQLSKCGPPGYYYGLEEAIVTYFDPEDCPESPTYPFAISSIDFQLNLWAGDYPTDVDIVVFDMLDPDDFCQGPGEEIYRFTYTCDVSFQFPAVGTADFPEPCCLNGPCFVGLEYRDPVEATATFDFGPTAVCDVWYYSELEWIDWYDLWGGDVGYPIIWVNGETYSADCQCDYAIGDYNGSGSFNVADIIASFGKLKGQPNDPALLCECPAGSGNSWAVAMDLNASCNFNIADVIWGFGKLRGQPNELVPCGSCPPRGWEPAPGGNDIPQR